MGKLKKNGETQKKYILDNPPNIGYNTFVTWFECDVKFDFSLISQAMTLV